MKVSKCCGAGPVDEDIMICPDCLEHLGDEDIEDEDLTCPECNGTGEVIDHSKINSASIDIPYKKCSKCFGKGDLEDE